MPQVLYDTGARWGAWHKRRGISSWRIEDEGIGEPESTTVGGSPTFVQVSESDGEGSALFETTPRKATPQAARRRHRTETAARVVAL